MGLYNMIGEFSHICMGLYMYIYYIILIGEFSVSYVCTYVFQNIKVRGRGGGGKKRKEREKGERENFPPVHPRWSERCGEPCQLLPWCRQFSRYHWGHRSEVQRSGKGTTTLEKPKSQCSYQRSVEL